MANGSPADFVIAVNRWVEETDRKLQLFKVAFALRLTERIKSYTPVKTGRLRASIQPIDLSADHLVIGTNVVYARRVEYGFNGKDSLGREYHQVGAGMFTKTYAEANEIAKQALQDINEGTVPTGD